LYEEFDNEADASEFDAEPADANDLDHGADSENDDDLDSQAWSHRDRDAKVEFGGWMPNGFRARKVRRPRKDVPEATFDDQKLKLAIFRDAMRRYRIANLYWTVGLNAREIAEELETTEHAVKSVIHRLKQSLK